MDTGELQQDLDSRKRPLDTDTEMSEPASGKRSHQSPSASSDSKALSVTSGDGNNNVHFKILVPSLAAGAIIGKGGETIAQLQRESGARVKMSKANDFYPGTTERVCLITGTMEAITYVHDFIQDKIAEKPDPSSRSATDHDSKLVAEREKQASTVWGGHMLANVKVKILVPNSTAGMIIGKGGSYIKQIKEDSGAYVQISQKAKEAQLAERCITVIGEGEQSKKACQMILQKIAEDPQSSSCPHVSYADVTGPVANFNPTGSPFANSSSTSPSNTFNNASPQSGMSGTASLLSALSSMSVPQLIENLQVILRNSGYSDSAVLEITGAMNTLANYGLLGFGLGLAGLGGAGGQTANSNSSSSMANLMNSFGSAANNSSFNSATANSSLYGAVGSSNATNSFGSFTSTPRGDRYGGGAGGMANDSSSFFNNYDKSSLSAGDASHSFNSSFNLSGLGPNNNNGGGGLGNGKSAENGDKNGGSKVDIEIPDSIVGAILGIGGKSLVEIQQYSGANIQISKKGVYAPGTRNRVVSITGVLGSVSAAQYLIQQRIQQEETKRAMQNSVSSGTTASGASASRL